MPVEENYAAAADDDSSVGSAMWGGTSNATGAPDTVTAGTTLFNSQSHYLVIRDFGLVVPIDAQITNISAAVYRTFAGQVRDVVVKLWHAGSVTGDNLADSFDWSGDRVYDDGNCWGTTLTPADVNSSGFGVAISVENSDGVGAAVGIDAVFMSVTYTLPGDSSSPPQFDSTCLVAFRRTTSRRTAILPSIGADDSLNFADQPSETPLDSPGAFMRRSTSRPNRRESFAGGPGDNLTDELASVDTPTTLLFGPAISHRRKTARPESVVITNSPPPDESHPCGCVGTAEVVSYGFATAEFVGGASAENGGGEFTAEMVETGYTAEIIDACDCEE